MLLYLLLLFTTSTHFNMLITFFLPNLIFLIKLEKPFRVPFTSVIRKIVNVRDRRAFYVKVRDL